MMPKLFDEFITEACHNEIGDVIDIVNLDTMRSVR